MEEQIMQIQQLLSQAQELLGQLVQSQAPQQQGGGQPSIGERFAQKAEEVV